MNTPFIVSAMPTKKRPMIDLLATLTTLPAFYLRALIGSTLLASVCGPLGCFLVWKRMAFFGDVLAHAALPGIALGIAFDLPPIASVLVISLALALILATLNRRRDLATDTMLGVLGPSALAFGFIGLSLVPNVNANLVGFLFGDILGLSDIDLLTIALGGLAVLTTLALLWRKLLAYAIDEEMAKISGYPTRWLEPALLLLLSIVIAIGIQIVGILLISALLLIPAATARAYAKTPKQMATRAMLLGATGSLLGLSAAWFIDIPASAAIVTALALLFTLSRLKPQS